MRTTKIIVFSLLAIFCAVVLMGSDCKGHGPHAVRAPQPTQASDDAVAKTVVGTPTAAKK